MMSLAPALAVPDMTASVEASAGRAGGPGPAQALKDFESLFIETLLRSSGLAQTLDTQGGPEGGVAGELLVRELARGLAEQLQLNFGRSLGIAGDTSTFGLKLGVGESAGISGRSPRVVGDASITARRVP